MQPDSIWRGDLDGIFEQFLASEKIPGGVLAVADGTRMVYLQAYGLADHETGRKTDVNDRFRIASLSKPITAAAIMVLVKKGVLALDDRVIDLMPNLVVTDPRGSGITVRHLLQHTGGFDSDTAGWPLFQAAASAQAVGDDGRTGCPPVAELTLAKSLQFVPGTHYAYSNIGYCILGMIITEVTGQDYTDFVQSEVLNPIGVEKVRLGEGQEEGASRVIHYRRKQNGIFADIFPSPDLLILGPAGGWTGTAPDLISFFVQPLDTTVKSAPHFSRGKETYYGLGWRVWPQSTGPNLTHYGAMPGSFSLVVKTNKGLTVLALFNARPAQVLPAFLDLYHAILNVLQNHFRGKKVLIEEPVLSPK